MATDETLIDAKTVKSNLENLFDIYEGTIAGLRRASAIIDLIAVSPDAEPHVQECTDTAAHHLREARAFADQLLEWSKQHAAHREGNERL